MQIGSALGSTLGRIVKVAESRMRVLVACGAAGGIAATFNAPLAGVFFSMELILRDFNTQSFGMVVLASVTASVIGRSMLGNQPFLLLPQFNVDHLAQYLLFAVLGLLAGAVGVAFSKVLYLIEDACDWGWRGPEWLRPAVGGILLGGLLLLLPEMYGATSRYSAPLSDRPTSDRPMRRPEVAALRRPRGAVPVPRPESTPTSLVPGEDSGEGAVQAGVGDDQDLVTGA